MTILYLLIPVSLIILIIAFFAFRWAIKNDQFDDMKSPSMIPLLDDTEEELAQYRQTQLKSQQSHNNHENNE